MNRELIIRLAREAGCKPFRSPEHWDDVQVFATPDVLERFAALVAAADREKVARWMIERSYATGHGDTIEDLLKELEWQVRESEREACAKVCEARYMGDNNREDMEAKRCAEAIRSRT